MRGGGGVERWLGVDDRVANAIGRYASRRGHARAQSHANMPRMNRARVGVEPRTRREWQGAVPRPTVRGRAPAELKATRHRHAGPSSRPRGMPGPRHGHAAPSRASTRTGAGERAGAGKGRAPTRGPRRAEPAALGSRGPPRGEGPSRGWASQDRAALGRGQGRAPRRAPPPGRPRRTGRERAHAASGRGRPNARGKKGGRAGRG
jgi:hypothetical protein